MPSFTDSFWTPDYATGLGVLYGKLQQGVVENKQILTMASMRADAEEAYGVRMGDIAPSVDRLSNAGFGKDDGASVKKAYEGFRTEMIEASRNHQKIAKNIRELVVVPFRRWGEQHEYRVQTSHDNLQARIKEHTKQVELVKKLRSNYFNKCRVVEDLEEENKLAFQDPEISSPKLKPTPKIVLPTEEEPEEEPVELGDRIYPPEEVKRLFLHILNNIKLGDVKVPIIGTYQNTSSGAEIVEYILNNMGTSSLVQAERIGQDMVDEGFLRLIGNMGSNFVNSSKMNYQWRSKVFQLTGIPENKKSLMRVTSIASSEDGASVSDSPISSVSEMIAGWNPLNNPYPNETPSDKLRREAMEADEKYKTAVRRLDQIRCRLQEEVIGNLRFMEQCELDRLKAIKAVVLDFSGAISNVIPILQSNVDNMMLYQETIQPIGDLRYLLENYRTGGFIPRVQAYENYYGSVEEQNFGVDLEARARVDRKRVPILVTTILTYLDDHYPELEGDEARRAIWLHNPPLEETHKLRYTLNNSKVDYHEVLPQYEIPIVASVLKLYLLELPDSLVSSQVYEIVKTIYSTTAHETTEEGRIKVLQSTLGQLRLVNIATLDAIMTHFTRLLDLTSANEQYTSTLAQTLSPCVLRPRMESSLTMDERHSYRLIRDLFAHKDAIFGELKRQSSALGISTSSSRPRAISTDESNRRAAMEARQRAIVNRSRATSPTGRSRHRRDRSSGASENGRFPINVAASPADRRSGPRVANLDVPNTELSPSAEEFAAAESQAEEVSTIASPGSPGSTPASATTSLRSESPSPPTDSVSDDSPTPTPTPAPGSDEIEKRGSISRSSIRNTRKPGLGSLSSFPTSAGINATGTESNRSSIVENEPTEQKGVTLEDKPMDD